MKETRILTIEGDLVRVERTIVEKEVSAAQFMLEIAKTQPLETGPLPTHCAAFFRWPDRNSGELVTVYLLEHGPGLQKVKYRRPADQDNEESRVVDLVLSWPRTLWFVECLGDVIKDVYITVVESPFRQQYQATPLQRLLMPNQYQPTGNLCMGDLTVNTIASLADRIDDLVKQIDESVWNTDLLPSYDGTGIDGLEDWAAKSATNPDFHRQITFPTHWGQTVGGLLRKLRGEERP